MRTATDVDGHAPSTAGSPALELPRTVQQLRARVTGDLAAPVQPQPSVLVLRVVGAHPGAGTTTVAVAVADALAGTNPGVIVALVDTHPAEASGLVCAADRELGLTDDGWLLGQRGPITVYRRPAGTTRGPMSGSGGQGSLPCPRLETHPKQVTVLDLGARELSDGPPAQSRTSIHRPTASVLVCRASVPGVRRAELALHGFREADQDDLVVVLVGDRRVPAVVKASTGPRLRALHDAHRVVHLPENRRLSVEGIDDRPLPSPVVQAGSAVLRLICPELLDPPSTRPSPPSTPARAKWARERR